MEVLDRTEQLATLCFLFRLKVILMDGVRHTLWQFVKTAHSLGNYFLWGEHGRCGTCGHDLFVDVILAVELPRDLWSSSFQFNSR